jgi:cell division protein FtsI (penicillin-binding protein 3)
MRKVQTNNSNGLVLRLPMWRSRVVLFLMFIGFIALLVRAFWIQGIGNQFYEEKGNRVKRLQELPAVRGKILDRNGEILATSLDAKSIIAYPDSIPNDVSPEKIRQLANLLEMSESEIRKRFNDDRNQVYLRRQVSPKIAQQIKSLDIPGIGMNSEYRRFYPEGEAMAHIVGFTNIKDKGQEGMEYSWEDKLAGKSGQRRVIIDRLGRVVDDVGDYQAPHNGADLQLSIDSKIQSLAFQEVKEAVMRHKAKAGGAVVLDIQTGEVLAMANWPTYDPHQRKSLSGEQLRNRVLTDTFEPGSTMKPFTIALALEKQMVTPNTMMSIGSKYQVGTKDITDSHPYGSLSVTQIIQKSSNIGTSKIALQMPAQDMWTMFQSVGLGQAPKIGFEGAVAGRLRPYEKWAKIDQATMSYGYGLSASLFQMARAYTIFARDGELVPISMMKVSTPPVGTRVISSKTALEVRSMLELVTKEGGTALKARVPGYRVGGKTGTAHKSQGKGGYASNKYNGFFVGLAPISAPRIVVAVMVDEPSANGHYGGEVAAPAFSTITNGALRALGVPPDEGMKDLVLNTNQGINTQKVSLSR